MNQEKSSAKPTRKKTRSGLAQQPEQTPKRKLESLPPLNSDFGVMARRALLNQ